MLSFYDSTLKKTVLNKNETSTEKKAIDKFVILPSSKLYTYFKYISGIMLVFTLVFFPPYAAFYFRNDLEKEMENFLEIALYIGDFIAFPNKENNTLVVDIYLIALNQVYQAGFYVNT